MTNSAENAAPPSPSEKKVYTCGTLKYTMFGLIMLFIWLLWGDFCWVLLNSAIPGILPLKLNEMGASDTTMSLLVRVLGPAIFFVLNPIVSFKSDRYRSRWGRRIPFLLWSTPIVGLFMVLMGCYEEVTQVVMGNAQSATILGFEFSRLAVSLMIFAVLIIGFDLVDIYNDTIYYYLFNDVVPPQFLARFLSAFRMVGLVAGLCYSAFFMPYALTHFRTIWVLGGIAYTVGFLLMCFFVKEGQYPPPPENVDKRKGIVSFVKTYSKECFSHKFYWYFFLFNAVANFSWCSGTFSILRNTGSLELSLKDLAWMGIVLSPITFALMYPAGWLADKLNPIRVFVIISFITVFTNVIQAIFIFTDFGPSINLAFMYGISIFFLPFSSLKDAAEMPMYMSLLPKDRYGQFCSANGMLRSFSVMAGSLVVGILMTHMGSLTSSGYSVATSAVEIAATKTQTVEWTEEAVGPWRVEYRDNDDRTGTITVPGAAAVKVYLSEVRTEHGWDHLTTNAEHPDDWSGNFDKIFSGEKSGDTLALRLASNMTKPGSFVVAKVAWLGTKTGEVTRAGPLWENDNATFSLFGTVENGKAGVPNATISFVEAGGGEAPAPVATDGFGNWAQNGFRRGGSYRVAASKTQPDGTWEFKATDNSFSNTPETGVKIAATWTEDTDGWTEEEAGDPVKRGWVRRTFRRALGLFGLAGPDKEPWSIKYQNNWDRTGTITVPGATEVKVFFETVTTQAGVDHLTTDAENAADRSGDFEDIYSEVKSGDTITLRLTTGLYPRAGSYMMPRRSGNLYNDYEIRVTKVKYRGTRTGEITRKGAIWNDSRNETFPLSGRVATASGAGVSGVSVQFSAVQGKGPVPEPVMTDAYGNWCQVGFARGCKYKASASKTEDDGAWTFTEPTVGDWKYRLYPVWTIVFQVPAMALLLLLYREWKRRGGTRGYTPPEV